jgi:ubiquinone biosynthesis protein
MTEPRVTLADVLAPLKETAAETARLLRHVGARLDALSLDLARDVGDVARDAQAFATAAREQFEVAQDQVRSAAEQAQTFMRATPRAARLATAGAAIVARHRWLKLRAAASGNDALTDEDHRDLARRTAHAAAELRGGIAKLGQLASCRPDLIGAVWASELASLQDDVPPIEVEHIRARIEAELGKPITEAFATFEDAPIAAASLAQVHGATLHDGTRVVVKVQVPGIEDIIAADIAALRTVASAFGDVPGIDLATLTDELSRALTVELDYEAEAAALVAFAADLGIVDERTRSNDGGQSTDVPPSSRIAPSRIRVPPPVRELSTGRVLTMTRIDGLRLTDWLADATPDARDRLLADLVGEVAAQILVRGRVHADPHPGIFLVTTSSELAILDFGCTLELTRAERAAYARLVLAIGSGNSQAAIAELTALGFTADNPSALFEMTDALIAAMKPGAAVSEINWETQFADQMARAKQLSGLVIPRSFVLLGRVLATMAGLLATYKPRIHVFPLIARYLTIANA